EQRLGLEHLTRRPSGVVGRNEAAAAEVERVWCLNLDTLRGHGSHALDRRDDSAPGESLLKSGDTDLRSHRLPRQCERVEVGGRELDDVPGARRATRVRIG